MPSTPVPGNPSSMTAKNNSNRNALIGLIGFPIAIGVGAFLSSAPLFMVKMFTAVALFFCYGLFTVLTVSALRIHSGKLRSALGLMLGVGVVYLTWAVRIPVFASGEVPFSFDPALIYQAVLDRAGSMELSRGFGQGTSTEGPSWLLLSTYLMEALAFVGVVSLGALVASPDDEKTDPEADTGAGETDSLSNPAA